MNIIKTTAPIPFEELKKYFEDDTIVFEIDVENSELKDDSFLTYISNIDIPVELKIEKEETLFALLKSYLNFDLVLNLELLEVMTLDILGDYRFNEGKVYSKFIKENKEILDLWLSRFDILVVYNMYTTRLYKEWLDTLEEVEDDCKAGINFISLLKYPETYSIWSPLEVPVKNSHMFEEYIFKGRNLYHYWANENNPLFLFQEAVLSGDLTAEEYVKVISNENIQK